jgi:hypothetical protein
MEIESAKRIPYAEQQTTCCCGKRSISQMNKDELYGWMIFLSFLGLFIVFPATFAPSFHYVRYDEMAFYKDLYGQIDTSTIVTQKRVLIPITKTIVKFPKTAQCTNFFLSEGDALPVFSSDGLSFLIDVTFCYYLTENNLEYVFTNFGFGYENLVINNARSTIKDKATHYPMNSYVQNHDFVERDFGESLRGTILQISHIEIEVAQVLLLNSYFPDPVIAQNLQSAVQIQFNQIQQNQQVVSDIIAQTNLLVNNIVVQTSLLLSNTNATTNLIVMNSLSQANNKVLSARGEGILGALNAMGIVDPAIRDEFIQLSAVIESVPSKILFGGTSTPFISL